MYVAVELTRESGCGGIMMSSEGIAYQAGPTVELAVRMASELFLWTSPPEPGSHSPSEIQCQLFDYRSRCEHDNLSQHMPKQFLAILLAEAFAAYRQSRLLGGLHELAEALVQRAPEMFLFGRLRIRDRVE